MQFHYIYIYNTGWWFETFFFPFSWECHHPNRRSPSFFRGVGIPPPPVIVLGCASQLIGFLSNRRHQNHSSPPESPQRDPNFVSSFKAIPTLGLIRGTLWQFNIAIENGHWHSGFMWIFPVKIVIFHSYVKLPEGRPPDIRLIFGHIEHQKNPQNHQNSAKPSGSCWGFRAIEKKRNCMHPTPGWSGSRAGNFLENHPLVHCVYGDQNRWNELKYPAW